MSRTSILIVNWNAGDALSRCLASLDLRAHEVVVVDNASTDGSTTRLPDRFPRITLIHEPVNRGFAGGVNRAARHAHGDHLLLLNPDVEAEPGAVERLSAYLDAHSRVGAAGGLLIDRQGEPQRGFTVRRFPTLAAWAVDLLLIDHLWPNNPATRRYLALDLRLDEATLVDQPAAACLMIRREVFDSLGGMDERFGPAWFEDVDFCRRVSNRGWTIAVVPAARFRHRGGLALERLGQAGFALIWYRNMERYAEKHHGRATRVALKGLIASGMLARAIASALRGNRAAARAYLGVLLRSLRGR